MSRRAPEPGPASAAPPAPAPPPAGPAPRVPAPPRRADPRTDPRTDPRAGVRSGEVPDPAVAVADAATADVEPSLAGPGSPELLTAPAPRPAPRGTLGLVVLLGSMAALGAVNTDLYLPSLPQVASDLGVSASATQLTITVVLVGMALGQLVVGPLSDRFGRRPPVVVGCALFVLASLGCLLAPSLPLLVALRFVQGVGVSAGAVTAMAVVRDLFTGPVASRLMSRLVLVIGVAPLFAPTVGGALAGVTGWRFVFVALALAGVALLLAVWRRLPETRRPAGGTTGGTAGGTAGAPAGGSTGGVGHALVTYARLLRDVRFVAFAVLPGLAMAVIVCYVSVSPFVLQEVHGLSPTQFALVFALNGVALVGGSQVNAALVTRVPPARLLRVAVPATLVLAAVLLVVVLTGAGGLVGLLVPLWLLLGTGSLVPPNAVTLALAEHGSTAGSAAALITAAQSGVGGGIGIVAGALGGDALAMAGVMLGATTASTVALAVAVRARRSAATG
ncbi:multidrug effflux MFS transporter [Kineococcus sp. SYSU DK006]|uniref:multidrug effflux MFS transporter n=1 Tax=Kineococcus sp. SYSU DK006 TaxID=3383127 RepID=UPI003D7E2B01